jgi:hypothetical protein
MAVCKPPSTIPSRGLNIRQASAYFGVSPNTFRKLVRLDLAPAAVEACPALIETSTTGSRWMLRCRRGQ